MSEKEEIYDLAIIGGGIAGAAIARDASLRGLHVIVFEKNRFGSGTSSKSSKLIHGGIRYLEISWNELCRGRVAEAWKNLCFVFYALRESSILEKIAPQLVRPIELVVPIYKHSSKNRWMVWGGTWIYFLLALLSGGGKTPKILWNKKSVLKLIPDLNSDDLVGGILLWDHETDDKRLVEETMRSAVKNGAQAIENAEVISYSSDIQKNVCALNVSENGITKIYTAKKIINASGPWVDKVRKANGNLSENYLLPVAGSHLEFKKFIPYSVILEAQDGRIFFVINRGDVSRVGTTERIYNDPDSVTVSQDDMNYLLNELNRHFPKKKINRDQILSQDAGIRPLAKPAHSVSAHEASREHELRVDEAGIIHVLGVKITDHRRAAEQIVNCLSHQKSKTAKLPL